MVKYEETRRNAGRRIKTEDDIFGRKNIRKGHEHLVKNEEKLNLFRKQKLSKNYDQANLNFISNAKPSFLSWRDVKVISAPIAKPNKIKGEAVKVLIQSRFY